MPLTLTPADLVDRNILAECELAAHSFLFKEWEKQNDAGFRLLTKEQRQAQADALALIMYHAAVIALPGIVNKEV